MDIQSYKNEAKILVSVPQCETYVIGLDNGRIGQLYAP